MSLFGASTTKPTLSLGGTSTNNTNSTSLFGNPPASNTNTTSLFNRPAATSAPATSSLFGTAPTTNNPTQRCGSLFGGLNQPNTTQQQQQLNAAQTTTSGGPAIDLDHLRNTTKFDHLQPAIQEQITLLDTAIQNQINQSAEVASALPAVTAAASQLAPAIDFVGAKLDELEVGLENDAAAIVQLRDGELKLDEGEAKCVFRNIDRLKVPRQYQIGHTVDTAANGGAGSSFGGSTGLSGWWNQPQTLRGVRSASGAAGQSLSLVSEDVDEGGAQGPKNLVGLFEKRSAGFREVAEKHRAMLEEIEDFVEGLEEKVVGKERELNERLNFASDASAWEERRVEERDRQMQMLRYVFGEVQRGLYEAADMVGTTRDGVVELGMTR